MRLSLRFTKRLKAPRREVFRLVTGYERLHERFPNLFSSVRVLDKSKDRVTTEETFFLLGATVTQRSRHEVRAPTLHRV